MSKQEWDDEAARIDYLVNALIGAEWRRWAGTSLLDFLVGLAVICLVGWLLYLLLGG